MNLKQKYGEWALVCGATDGIGKAFAEYFAANGLSVVLVGRRAEKLQALAEELEQGYGVKAMAVPQDLTADSASENLIKATESLDIGILNYVATFHKMGRYSHAAYPDIQKIIDININTYAKLLHHFTALFAARDRGAVVTMTSLTAVTASPYNAAYGAAKAFQLILTEGVAREFHDADVDILVITAGSTQTPDWFRNQPQGDIDNSQAMTPQEVVEEGMGMLGKANSYIVGRINQDAYKKYTAEMTRDEAAALMGSYFEEEYRDK